MIDRSVKLIAGCIEVAGCALTCQAHPITERVVSDYDGYRGDEARVLPYSPGYCGWHVSGQRALFAYLDAGEIGVTLNASCLMNPLKSVSGVLAAGPPDIHRFAPTYACCAECRNRTCLGRQSLLSAMMSAE